MTLFTLRRGLAASALLVLALAWARPAEAQKFGYIDSRAIIERMPEWKTAQSELQKASAAWQKEVEDKFKEADNLRRKYIAEEILMTEEMRKERKAEIDKKDAAARDAQKKIFGFEGQLFLKRQELEKPVQDKMYEQVEKVCKQKKLQIMFDKASDIGMVYTDPKHDYTEYVLEELGLGDKNDTLDKNKGAKQEK
jgi:outer membrane protein